MKKEDLEKAISEEVDKYEKSVGLKVDWINITRKKSVGFNIDCNSNVEANVKIENN